MYIICKRRTSTYKGFEFWMTLLSKYSYSVSLDKFLADLRIWTFALLSDTSLANK
jgi:hypothetical protein